MTPPAVDPPRDSFGAYLRLSRRPLHIFVFVLPLVLLYEIGVLVHAPGATEDGRRVTLEAYRLLDEWLRSLGAGGPYVPGGLLLLVLLAWHVVRRDEWSIQPAVSLTMWLEAAAWTLPLVVLDQVIHRLGAGGVSGGLLVLAAGGPTTETIGTLQALPWIDRLLLAVGAGIYEEMLFRLLLIAVVHWIARDLARMPRESAALLAVLVSTIVFTAFHDLTPAGTDRPDPSLILFYASAGLAFATLYVVRGFGIVVGTHALYDVLAIVVLPALAGG